jgi:hypothetical protein
MKARSDVELTKEDRERLKTSPIRYDATQGNFFWEGIPDCSGKKCPIYATCQYPKVGVCGLRKRYLSVVERLVLGCLEKKSPRVKLKVGFHLIPLYNQLFVAKLNCIANESPENTREVRGILRAIESIFKTLGKKKPIPGEDVPSTPETDYYDQMSSTGIEEAKRPAPVVSISKRKLRRGPKVKVNLKKLDKEFDII